MMMKEQNDLVKPQNGKDQMQPEKKITLKSKIP
jgi:hypothetical protein